MEKKRMLALQKKQDGEEEMEREAMLNPESELFKQPSAEASTDQDVCVLQLFTY